MNRRVAAAAFLAVVAISAAGCVGSSGSAHAPYAGSVLAFARPGELEGLGVDNTDLVAVSPSGRLVADITPGTAGETDPVWSANGRVVVFQRAYVAAAGRTSAGVPEYRLIQAIYSMDTGGSDLRRVAACSESCGLMDFAISPDGRYVAYVAQPHPRPGISTDAGEVVMVFDTRTGHARTVCEHNSCGYGLGGLAWSPNGRSIALSNQAGAFDTLGIGPLASQIWVVDVANGRSTALTGTRCRRDYATCTTDAYPAWSPDGKQIAFSRYGPVEFGRPAATAPPSGLMLMNADGSDLHVLSRCTSRYCPQQETPVWAPDGRYLAVPTNVAGPTITIVRLDGKTNTLRTCLHGACQTPVNVVWSPDSRTLAFTTNRYPRTYVYTIGVDGHGMRPVAIAEYGTLAWLPGGVVTPSAMPPVPSRPARPARPSGELVYSGQESRPTQDSRTIWIQPTSGGSRTLILRKVDRNVWAGDPAWSPDGRTIAFDQCCTNGKRQIYLMNRSGGDIHPVTTLADGATQPAWSPDGVQLAFTANTHYPPNTIDVVDADGRDLRTVTSGRDDGDPAWSPNSRWIAFVRTNSSGSAATLELVRPNGADVHSVVDLPGVTADPTWSPDGEWIAFEWNDLGGDNIYEVHPNGTGLRRLTSALDGAEDPAFSPDGSWIAFASGGGGRVDLYLTPVDAFEPVRLTPRQGIYDHSDWRR